MSSASLTGGSGSDRDDRTRNSIIVSARHYVRMFANRVYPFTVWRRVHGFAGGRTYYAIDGGRQRRSIWALKQ